MVFDILPFLTGFTFYRFYFHWCNLSILAGLYNCSPAIADTPCDYIHKVDSQFTKQIDKTENVNRKVFQHVEDTRKCIMTMDIFYWWCFISW